VHAEIKPPPVSIFEKLGRDGFAIVPDAVPESTIAGLAAVVEAAWDHESSPSRPARRHLIQTMPAVREVAESAAIRELVEPVLGPTAFVARSLFFDKTPEANWKVA